MEMVDDDGYHPVIGTSICSMGVIFAKQKEYGKARQYFEEAKNQFEQIQDELLGKGKTTEELIGTSSSEKLSTSADCWHHHAVQLSQYVSLSVCY